MPVAMLLGVGIEPHKQEGKDDTMFGTSTTEYLVLRDGSPYKLMRFDGQRVSRFCRRLADRFPSHDWSVVDRFLPQGAD